MYLNHIHVRNFGCLENVDVELAPLTVLIGPNDSGKSTVLRAIEVLGRLQADESLSALFPTADDFQQQTFNANGQLMELGFSGRVGTYKLVFGLEPIDTPPRAFYEELRSRSRGQRWERHVDGFPVQPFKGTEDVQIMVGPDAHPRIRQGMSGKTVNGEFQTTLDMFVKETGAAIASARRFRLNPDRLREPVPLVFHREDMPMEPDGYGLAGVVADLLHRHRHRLEAIEARLREAIPHIDGVNLRQRTLQLSAPWPWLKHDAKFMGPTSCYALEFRSSSGNAIPHTLVSDGVLLYLAYLTLTMGQHPHRLLLIEEPELGIHPGLLAQVMTLLNALAKGDPPVQVILTTHSPLLLNHVDPKAIRMVHRDSGGATQILPFSDIKDIARLLEYQGPGEVWVNLGEDELARRQRE